MNPKERSLFVTLMCCIAIIAACVLLLVVAVTPRVDWAVYGSVCAGVAAVALLSAYAGGILACAHARASVAEQAESASLARHDECGRCGATDTERYPAWHGGCTGCLAVPPEPGIVGLNPDVIIADTHALAGLTAADITPGGPLMAERSKVQWDVDAAAAAEMLLAEVETMRAGINELDSKHQYVPVDVLENTLAVMEDAAAILTGTGHASDTPSAPDGPIRPAPAEPDVNSLAPGSALPPR